jgi:signal transduction histidine kinase
MVERASNEQDLAELASHLENSASALEYRIESNDQTLASIITRDADRTELLREQIRIFLDDRSEMLMIGMVDRQGIVEWIEPEPAAAVHIGGNSALFVPDAALAQAFANKGITYSKFYQTANGENGFAALVPLPDDTESRVIVCVYSTERLLRQTISRQTLMNYHVSLIDRIGLVVASLPTGERLDPDLVDARTLKPPGNGLLLKLSKYHRPFWTLGALVLMALCVSLVAGMAWGMWSLKRQVRKRIRAEVGLRRARDELEQRVAARTVDLKQANEKLQREMTERQRAEEEARRHQDQLAHAARMGTMGEMAAGLAHELNQPLGSIASYADGMSKMLQNGVDAHDPMIREAVSEIAGQARHAGQIIHSLREFVAPDSPQQTWVSIAALVDEVAGLLRTELRHSQVALSTHIPQRLPKVLVDRIQIQQVLVNLVRNAIEALSETDDKRIAIAAGVAGGHRAIISVTDNGVGCDTQTLRTMFEPFFTTRTSGMGMGLTISRSIVEAHGGELTASINPKGGLTFRFTLPLSEGVEHVQDRDEPHPHEAGQDLRGG